MDFHLFFFQNMCINKFRCFSVDKMLKLQIAGSWLKNKELPKVGRFTTVDAKFLKDAKTTLNEYLKVTNYLSVTI